MPAEKVSTVIMATKWAMDHQRVAPGPRAERLRARGPEFCVTFLALTLRLA